MSTLCQILSVLYLWAPLIFTTQKGRHYQCIIYTDNNIKAQSLETRNAQAHPGTKRQNQDSKSRTVFPESMFFTIL